MKNKNKPKLIIFQKKNRKGWIEIVEAFVAVLLIAGVVLIVLNKGYLEKTDISNQIYQSQLSILREVETNDTMRGEILGINNASIPISWYSSSFPNDIKNLIIIRTPNYLNCTGKICNVNNPCNLEEAKKTDVYSQSVVISSTLRQGAIYRQVNLFCWTK